MSNSLGKAPYGYSWDGDQLAPVEHEQAALAIIAEELAKGKSLRWIVQRLNGAGALTRHGGSWQVSSLAKIVKRLTSEQQVRPDHSRRPL